MLSLWGRRLCWLLLVLMLMLMLMLMPVLLLYIHFGGEAQGLRTDMQ